MKVNQQDTTLRVIPVMGEKSFNTATVTDEDETWDPLFTFQ
jgi:hypothetical protein